MSPMPVKPSRSTRSFKTRAVTLEKRRWRLPEFTKSQAMGWLVALAIVLAPLLAWHLATRKVRGELQRVEAYLESQQQYQDVDLSIPFFALSMPGKVALTAIGLPSGYSYEVRVELKGEYDTTTRAAHLKGVKQVLSPYIKAIVDDQVAVPVE